MEGLIDNNNNNNNTANPNNNGETPMPLLVHNGGVDQQQQHQPQQDLGHHPHPPLAQQLPHHHHQHQWFGGPMLVDQAQLLEQQQQQSPNNLKRWNHHRYHNRTANVLNGNLIAAGASHYYPPPGLPLPQQHQHDGNLLQAAQPLQVQPPPLVEQPPVVAAAPVRNPIANANNNNDNPPQQYPTTNTADENDNNMSEEEGEADDPNATATTKPNKFKSRNRATWPQMLEQLQRFKSKTGHCNVPCRYKANPSLAHWVKTQRYKYSQEHMTADRIDALEALGFEWRRASTELFDQRWNIRYGELVEYKRKFGDTRVPFEWPENKALSMWVSRERQNYKRGLLRKDKYERLQELGFDWNLAEFGKGIRPDRMRQPNHNRQNHHHEPNNEQPLQPPPTQAPKIPSPPPGVAPQNLPALPPRPGRLEPDRNKRHAKWMEMFQELQRFHQEHGHCVAPQPRKGNNVLGRWVKNQHDNYTKGLLYADQIAKLESLGIVWRLRAFGSGKDRKHDVEKFHKKLGEMVDYQREHGHTVPPKHTVLGEWASRQRFLYRRNCLPEERVQKLNEIGFVWQSRKSWKMDWEEQFAKLRVFKTVQGHCNVPKDYQEEDGCAGGDLAKWVKQQRDAYKKEELEQSTIDQLEGIGFVWDPTKAVEAPEEEEEEETEPDPKKMKMDHASLQMELSQLRNKLQEERVKLRHQKVQAFSSPQQPQQQQQSPSNNNNPTTTDSDTTILLQEQTVQHQEERVQWHQDKMILQLENNGLIAANQKLRADNKEMGQQLDAQEQLLQLQGESIEAQTNQLKAQAETIRKQGEQLRQLKELVLKSKLGR